MITFYRTTEDTGSQEIQEVLRELCLAHEVVLVTDPGASRGILPEGTRPPVLVDEGTVYQDRSAIQAHLEELKAIRELWYKYGGDACYCDAEGNVE
ncbi:MAG: hypothetical protein JO355_01660 [Planctomycetaceae bacterium]|nr:hypothetical protein [Planctomycetaceae bacterium]MBV8267396.1 hypothetical protein [Planctomycetaceae bacterium]MBV8675858.1 hypothetical protein [Planctomycetaceae bacterium]